MKKTIKKLSKFITSRMLYLFIGLFLALAIFAGQAAWNSYVNSGQTLTNQLWNDVVDKLIGLDNSIGSLDMRITNLESRVTAIENAIACPCGTCWSIANREQNVSCPMVGDCCKWEWYEMCTPAGWKQIGQKQCTEINPGGPWCFVSGTKITMSNGLLKNIEKVVKGESVLGRNGAINTVLGYRSHPVGNGKIYSINEKIEVTGDHPFLAKDGKWKVIDIEFYNSYSTDFKVRADKLKVGDILMTKDGEEEIVSIELVKDIDPTKMVYDLIVGGDHTYMANGFIVHTE